ncbi:hypothetical protein IPZ61_32405 [Streptomyces sioyaensis]|uniref:hypothetical protein n=1 Tax=Streptomyces sioyaensis TaxID=67364 RepID=UPI001F475CFF|nr:hypothetical protein [Streptomyces sioyaensis]MCF3178003.1 hypothetical protein [Streptomyces sioyaensis]
MSLAATGLRARLGLSMSGLTWVAALFRPGLLSLLIHADSEPGRRAKGLGTDTNEAL